MPLPRMFLPFLIVYVSRFPQNSDLINHATGGPREEEKSQCHEFCEKKLYELFDI